MDTGLNIRHLDIGTGRRSICGANFAPLFNARQEDLDLWQDDAGHGSHVTGTLLGSGMSDPRFAGMAPGVRDIRFAKVLSSLGFGDLDGVLRGMDFLARPTACAGSDPAKALLVNVSLGEDGIGWEGRTVAERKIDTMAWHHRQLYVVANGNGGSSALGDVAGAKNSLSVGAVVDGGDIWVLSSHGPTADGRLAPSVVGTGVAVRSAHGAGRRAGHWSADGTSMASPSVAGVAALLMDAVPGYREQPAAVRARLMASAIRPDAFLDDAAGFPAHNGNGPGRLQHRYGLGKVSARTAVLSRDLPDGWTSGGAVAEPADGEYAYHDVDVPPGASRLDIVMTWDEPPAETFAGPVLNDLDLWVDRGADCPPSQPAACGDAASRSTIDNVEWLVLRNPEPGTYRLKVVPKHARVEAPRAALAWTVIRGPSTPRLAVSAAADAVAAEPGAAFGVDLAVSVDGYVASGTMLRIDCRGDDVVCSRVGLMVPRASSAVREDAVVRSLDGDTGNAITLGEVAAGEEQRVSLVFRGPAAPARFRLHFTATSWNGRSGTASVDVDVGGTGEPATPTASVPANDGYADAELLAGDSGVRAVDLLLATPEPGEPPVELRAAVPAQFGAVAPTERPRSAWYAWTAPRTDAFRFGIDAGGPLGVADDVAVDVFEAGPEQPLVGLRPAAHKVGGGVSFAAVRGRAYRLRLGLVEASLAAGGSRRIVDPVTLRWSLAARPENDDFATATPIGGGGGAVGGTNLGATTEAGERLVPLAATTWFRWTAPADGDYRFAVNRRRLAVAAFAGDDLSAIRLVSGLPDNVVVFPTGAGKEYRIVVAAPSAYGSGADYTLDWGPGVRHGPPNDDRASAESIGSDRPFHFAALEFDAATVEPGEPADTGVRTTWYRWTPPAAGGWTWRARRGTVPVRMSVFRDSPAGGLVRVAGTDPDARTDVKFSWQAAAGASYLVSAGLTPEAALLPFGDELAIEWGRTPDNDRVDAAAVLAGASGSVSGSNDFATVDAGEGTAGLGGSSMWWTWESPVDGWQRFSADSVWASVLAVFRRTPDGGLEQVAVSRRLGTTSDAVFRAEAGATYAVRFGSPQLPGPFELSWAPHGRPAWLRYAGALEDGGVDDAGRLVHLANPRAMVVRPDGRELYAATAAGLQVHARRPQTGGLAHVQTVPFVDNHALLLWDAQSGSLVAGSCSGWRRFTEKSDGSLRESGISGPAPCGGTLAFSAAAVAGVVAPWGLDVYRFSPDGESVEAQARLDVPWIDAAAVSKAGDFVYVAALDQLHVFRRDVDTGELVPHGVLRDGVADADGETVRGLGGVRALAVDDEGEVLFAFGAGGLGTAAFDLSEPGEPRFVDAMEPFQPWGARSVAADPASSPAFAMTACSHASVRPGRLAVDAVCSAGAFAASLLPGGVLRAEDYLNANGEDRYGGEVPEFVVTGGVVPSPDGRHLYAALDRGVLILRRAP